MYVTKCRYVAGQLILDSDSRDAAGFAMRFRSGDYDIKPIRQRRSLDANAYAWLLMDKLAAVTGYAKTEIYRNYMLEIGGNSEIFVGSPDAVERLKKDWVSRGIGWQTEPFPTKDPRTAGVVLYFGSSSFDSKEMSVLIDHIQQDCLAVGIEIRDPGDVESMLKEWDKPGRVRE